MTADGQMLSVVIPTRDSEEALARTLAGLVAAAADGTVREVIVVDGGSDDATASIAEGTGCLYLRGEADLSERLAAGAEAASRGDYLMFLPPGVLLTAGWEADFAALIERLSRRGKTRSAMVFRFGVDDVGLKAGLRQAIVRLMAWVTGIPHFDQGLIVPKLLYREIGGIRGSGPLCLADVCRRLGRSRIVALRAVASRIAADRQSEAWLPGLGRGRGALALGFLALRLPLSVIGPIVR